MDMKLPDNGGRRSGIDRRQFSYSSCIPERRKQDDRRSGEDRRKGYERRRVTDRRRVLKFFATAAA